VTGRTWRTDPSRRLASRREAFRWADAPRRGRGNLTWRAEPGSSRCWSHWRAAVALVCWIRANCRFSTPGDDADARRHGRDEPRRRPPRYAAAGALRRPRPLTLRRPPPRVGSRERTALDDRKSAHQSDVALVPRSDAPSPAILGTAAILRGTARRVGRQATLALRLVRRLLPIPAQGQPQREARNGGRHGN
jgi:hypothetical protein